MVGGTPWWSRERVSKAEVRDDDKSADDGGEGDEDDEEDDVSGDCEGSRAGASKRRLASRLQAPEKSNLVVS